MVTSQGAAVVVGMGVVFTDILLSWGTSHCGDWYKYTYKMKIRLGKQSWPGLRQSISYHGGQRVDPV